MNGTGDSLYDMVPKAGFKRFAMISVSY